MSVGHVGLYLLVSVEDVYEYRVTLSSAYRGPRCVLAVVSCTTHALRTRTHAQRERERERERERKATVHIINASGHKSVSFVMDLQ